MYTNLNILLVEDNIGDQFIIKKYLSRNPAIHFIISTCVTLSEAKQLIDTDKFDVILLDLTLPDSSGLDTFLDISKVCQPTPIIILTGLDIQEVAADAVRAGAQDYLIKGEHLQNALERSILYAIERAARLKQEVELARAQMQMQTIESLIRNVTHDLKTPLSVIQSSGELLEYYVDKDNPNIIKHLSQIDKQSKRLHQMINNIVEIFQLSTITKLHNDELEPIDLCKLIQRTRPTFNAELTGQNLEYIINGDCPIMIYGNSDMITKTISTVMINAISHTPETGEIQLQLTATEDYAIIQIVDSGIGISAEHLPHIFDRFYRVDPSRKSNTGSGGLGLSITKRIIELHQGKITVESQVAVGTTFEITLPRLHEE